MDLNKKNMKRIALLIAFGLLLYWGLNHPGQAGQMLSTVFSISCPFCWAAVWPFCSMSFSAPWNGVGGAPGENGTAPGKNGPSGRCACW